MNQKVILPQKYSLGFENWDKQHAELIVLLQDMVACKKNHNVSSHNLEPILNSLLKYTRIHFDYEEAKMKKINYADITAHLAEHQVFTQKINDLYRMKRDHKLIDKALDFIRKWYLNHIQEVDRKLSQTILEYQTSLNETDQDQPILKSKLAG